MSKPRGSNRSVVTPRVLAGDNNKSPMPSTNGSVVKPRVLAGDNNRIISIFAE